MSKLIRNDFRDPVCPASDLAIGEMATFIDNDRYTGHVVLRTYSEIVDLDDPRATWGDSALPHHKVRRLAKGESVTLVQE